MKTMIRTLLTLTLSLLMLATGRADDTDIYLNNNGGNSATPIIIFTIDYRSNLGSTACNGTECDVLKAGGYINAAGPYSFFDVIRGSMLKVMDPLSGYKVGIMVNHNNTCSGQVVSGPNAGNCSNGAYFLFAPRFMDAGTDDPNKYDTLGEDPDKVDLMNKLKALVVPQGNLAHPFQGKELYFELFRYLTGQGIYNGHLGYNDYGYDGKPAKNLDVINPSLAWDTSIENSDKYISPLKENCGRVFLINMMFQVSAAEADSDTAIQAAKGSGGMAGLVTGATFEQTIKWMYDVDLADGTWGTVSNLHGKQNVTSYYLVDPSKLNNTTNGYAINGGTSNALGLSTDPNQLIATLENIFRQILSVSTTFVAGSIPVNVFNRAEVMDSFFIAIFMADKDGKPLWPGNLKKLKIKKDIATSSLVLVDSLGAQAIDVDGRIIYDGLTFWTNGATLPPADATLNEVAGRDGRSVARGGAGQRIPGYYGGNPGALNTDAGARKLYTEPATYTNGTPTSFMALNADNATATALQSPLGAVDATEALTLLKYARGQDVNDADGDGNLTEGRKWILGDPLHSRPMPINYGVRPGYTASNPDIRVIMGTNDGYLHMFRNTDASGLEDGAEIWAFMPRAVMSVVKKIKANTPGVKHPYGVDGPPVVHINDTNNNGTIETGEQVIAYFGLRRGGKAYYALDISDPDAPKLLWSISKAGDFAELAMTFSMPKVGIMNWGSGKKPVLVFGGGYAANKDSTSLGTNDSEGNAIYIVDAMTGSLVWKAVQSGTASSKVYVHSGMLDSIPSDLSAVDTDGDGLMDRIYTGDTGGVVWRADMAGTDTSKWTVTKLFSGGRHYINNDTNDRRFFNKVDFVKTQDSLGPYDAVILGSGDREHPLKNTVENWFYMIKDRNITSGQPPTSSYSAGDLIDLSSNCLQDVSNTCVSADDLKNGWRIKMYKAGEKVLSSPITISGTVYFTTYVPATDANVTDCAPKEGKGLMYAVNLQDATAVLDYDSTNTDADGGTLHASDRYKELSSAGIPTSINFLCFNGECALQKPDGFDKTSDRGVYKTYWYEKGK